MMKKIIKNGSISLLMAIFIFFLSVSSVQAMSKGWVIQGKDYKYRINESYVRNKVVKIGKKFYYFNKKGVRKTGWVKYKGDKYYFDTNKGYAYTGKKKIDKQYYIFKRNGKLVTKKGFYKLNKKKYYITKKGNLAVGLLRRKGKCYFFQKNAQLAKKKGIYILNGKKYYVLKGHVKLGWVKIGNTRKHFNTKYGYMDTGLVQINGKQYYLSDNGNPISGFVNISGKKYYFDRN